MPDILIIMQHTLLPAPERESLKKEYRIRLGIVLCFMISLAGLVGVVALIPALTRALSGERAALDAGALFSKRTGAGDTASIESELGTDMSLLSVLKSDAADPPLAPLALEIVSLKGPLTITSLAMSRVSTSTVTVTLQGLAPTRNSLIAFEDSLESAMPGNKVDLPVNELANETDIPYSLQVIWTLQ